MTTLSTPSHIRDSVVFRRSGSRLSYTGAEDGRFVFVICDDRASDEEAESALEAGEDLNADQAVSFNLFAYDILLSKRIRLGTINDLYSFGKLTKFYTLNVQTIVIIDYHEAELPLLPHLCDDLSRRQEMDHRGRVLIHPVDPLGTLPHRDITTLVARANRYAQQAYLPGLVNPIDVSLNIQPFIVSNTEIGFFIDNDDVIDLESALVLDFDRGSFSLREITSSSRSFPHWIDNCRDREDRYWAVECDIRGELDNNWPFYRQSQNGQVIAGCDSEGEDVVLAFASLSTATFQWTEIKADPRLYDEMPFHTLSRDGSHIVLASETRAIGVSRVSWKGDDEEEKEDDVHSPQLLRFQLVRHPLRVDTLLRLATIALQKSGRVGRDHLQKMADRLG